VTVLRGFDANGSAVDAFGTAGRLDVQLDGKATDVFDMVTVGDDVVMLVRVDGTHYDLVRVDAATGTVDPSFGVDGRAATDIEVLSPNPLAVDEDSRIWVAGQEISSGSPVAQIQCRTSNGVLDPSWGGDGVVVLDSGMAERGAAITFDDAGRVYAATELGEDMMGTLTVRRFMPDGTVDASWGTNGIALPANTDEGANGAFVYDMEIQPDGRIVVLGQHSTFWLARFRTDGSADPTLGVMGILTLDTLNLESPIFSNLEIDGEGMLILGGGFGPSFAQSAVFKLWF
jgi:serralysin